MSHKADRTPDPKPFPFPTEIDPWLEEHLVKNVFHGDLEPLKAAVEKAYSNDIPQMNDWGIKDAKSFLLFASGMLKWTPTETANGKMIYNTLCLFYFVLDQEPLCNDPWSNKIEPPIGGINPENPLKIKHLSKFVVKFAQQIGAYMDTPGSKSDESIASFVNSPLYHYAEAQVPPGGWKTFNQLFARHLKPGMRPISCPDDDRVIVYPADSTFDGKWDVDSEAQVRIKEVDWKISDLLYGSEYAHHFAGGQWMHAFLNTYDYHRQHAPVSGKVVEANVIPGLAYLQVWSDPSTGKMTMDRGIVKTTIAGTRHGLRKANHHKNLMGDLDAPDHPGYQFIQSRGCVIIHNDLLGYVAVLPIGMAQVSSVKLVWEPKEGEQYPIHPNVDIKKGDEISHFEFGGSDIVLVFQKDANVQILGASGRDEHGQETFKQKYLVGEPLGFSLKGLGDGSGANGTNGYH